jgi:hypothetical protein
VVIEMVDELSVELIEKTLAVMEAERINLLDQQTQHDEQERRLAFDARLGSAEAGKLLGQLLREKSKMQNQIDSIDAAKDEGQRRLAHARALRQQAENAVKAEALRKVLARFTASGREVEQAVATVVRSSHEMRTALNELHASGVGPRFEAVDALGFRALSTELRRSLWGNHFRPLGSDEKRHFVDLIASWSAAIEGAITMQFGAQTDEAA